MKRKWILILNTSHTSREFTSQRKLREWAKENQLYVKRSYTDDHCFYTIDHSYVPAN